MRPAICPTGSLDAPEKALYHGGSKRLSNARCSRYFSLGFVVIVCQYTVFTLCKLVYRRPSFSALKAPNAWEFQSACITEASFDASYSQGGIFHHMDCEVGHRSILFGVSTTLRRFLLCLLLNPLSSSREGRCSVFCHPLRKLRGEGPVLVLRCRAFVLGLQDRL